MAITFVFHVFFIQIAFTAVATITYSCLSNLSCGCSVNSAILSKIIGGEQADIDSWGWIVSIRIGNSHVCGGSLISSTLILTAAHCLMSIKSLASLNINAGSTYLSIIHQQRKVSQIYIHQYYDSNTFVNDIAIIRLSSPINMNDRSIALICLPSTKTIYYPPTDTTVVAIGWGVLSSGNKVPSDSLQQVTLKTLSKTSINCRTVIHNNTIQFCSGVPGGGKDTCQGDSGGPLMIFSKDQWILVGITSYGISCALADYPGVYTRVSYYIDWISCFLTNNITCIENTTLKQYSLSSMGSTIFYKNILIVFILFLLFLFGIFDATISITYTCSHYATCGCSKRSTIILSKIIDGEPVTISHSWGWMASLRRNDIHHCGASLISPSYVITAAHCVNDIPSLSRLSLNFDITNLSNIGELRNVTKMYVHPLYDQRLYINDLAILRLHKPIDLINSNMSVICLPTKTEFNLEQAEYPPIGSSLIAIGWGTTNPFIRIPSPTLQQVIVQAIARTDSSCLNTINDDVVQFCAGVPEGGKDTCQGDSGGPLMLFKNGRWQLIGITSYGAICASPGFAGVYTRIAYYDSYIREIIQSDDTLKSNIKKLELENESRSSTKNLYKESMIQLCFICVFITYRKLFYQN
ncbi:unnamed protein product [Rotaria sp. Silwood1]|nr:unnamed protein product [Rotaria sp. Silwood1]